MYPEYYGYGYGYGRNPQPIKYRGTLTGLRISSVDGTAFIDNAVTDVGQANAAVLHEDIAVTLANSRISAAAGAAFYDDSDGTNLLDSVGKYLVVKDSAGKLAKGWIKAAGSGETLGSELVINPNFDLGDQDWDKTTGWTIVDQGAGDYQGVATDVAANIPLFNDNNSGQVINRLYKATATCSNYTTGDFQLTVQSALGTIISTGTFSETGTITGYGTSNYTGISRLSIYARDVVATTLKISAASSKQVLTPSATGVTISSTKGGTAMDNWESLEAGFNYNDGSGYTYTIYDRDITALADGNHLIEIYDASGRMLSGVLSSVGVTEGLGDDIFDLWNFTSGWTPGGSATINDANTFTSSGTGIGAYIGPTVAVVTKNALYVGSYDGVSGASKSNSIVGDGLSGLYISDGQTDKYFNAFRGTGIFIYHATTATDQVLDVATLTLKQVTAPSTSGSTIVSAKGGATEEWVYKNADFTMNAASYYCVVKELR